MLLIKSLLSCCSPKEEEDVFECGDGDYDVIMDEEEGHAQQLQQFH